MRFISIWISVFSMDNWTGLQYPVDKGYPYLLNHGYPHIYYEYPFVYPYGYLCIGIHFYWDSDIDIHSCYRCTCGYRYKQWCPPIDNHKDFSTWVFPTLFFLLNVKCWSIIQIKYALRKVDWPEDIDLFNNFQCKVWKIRYSYDVSSKPKKSNRWQKGQS